jgi:acyl-CoA hydrolase
MSSEVNFVALTCGVIGGIVGSVVVSKGSSFTTVLVLVIAVAFAYWQQQQQQQRALAAAKKQQSKTPSSPAKIAVSPPAAVVAPVVVEPERLKSPPKSPTAERLDSPRPVSPRLWIDDVKQVDPQALSVQIVSVADCVRDPLQNWVVCRGTLLSWMEVTASICATKRLRKVSTPSGLDFVHFLRPVPLDTVVSLQANVVRTSKAGVEIKVVAQSESTDGRFKNVCCSGFITFVPEDEKTELKEEVEPVPQGSAALLEARAALLNQKKQFADEVKDAEKWKQAWESQLTQLPKDGVPVGSTSIQMTEVVEPQHTNITGYTSGGWILRWIEQIGTLCANRHCGDPCKLAVIDDLSVGKSQAGWLLTFNAQVTRVFKTSLEIRVNVIGLCGGAETNVASACLSYSTYSDLQIKKGVLPKGENEEKEYFLASKRRTVMQETLQKISSHQKNLTFSAQVNS